MATYMYNEHDVNQVKNMQKKIKKKKQKRRRCFVLIVLIIIACIIFMTGNASKVKKISVSGCHLTNQENIIEHISIKSKETYFFKVNKNQVKKEIEQMIFIKKATVKLKNRFYSCFFAIKLASGEWQVTSGKLRKKFSLC